jgi:hypothetical protein
VSGQIRQGFTGYLGIINGVVYQIDSTLHTSWRPLEVLPVELQSNALHARLANPLNERPLSAHPDAPLSAPAPSEKTGGTSGLIGKRATVERVPVQKDEATTRLFTREGAESLRAGHPDLWHLLIAGTCLEGSAFKS